MASRVSFSNQELRVRDIGVYYANCAAALRDYYVTGNSAFAGYTIAKLKAEFSEHIDELNRTCAFLLLSTVEARLRIDYLKRCYEKRKDTLSRSFRRVYATRQEKSRLSEDILEVWKKNGAPPTLIGELRGAIKYRDWLAHGRYWNPKLGKKYDYLGLFELASGVERLVQSAP